MVVTTRETPIKSLPHTEYVLLMSDPHIGAAFVDYDRIKQDLRLAREHSARITINGDVFDNILPKDMKRYNPTALHPRLQNRSDILNAAVDFAFEILEPYKDLIDVIGVGNHDTCVEQRHSLDAVSILIQRLNQSGAKINHGGYAGWYVLRWKYGIRSYYTLKIRYHHGAGGASPVTKGITDFQRMNSFIEGADVVHVGHKHNRFVDTSHMKQTLSNAGKVEHRRVVNVMTGSYMDTYSQQESQEILDSGRRQNYAADWNIPQQEKGGVLLRIDLVANKDPYVTALV